MSGESFDLDAAFDEDYLHFYASYLTEEQDRTDAELIADLLGLAVGDRVLDLACGHGRIATHLAAIGCRVTGLDRSTLFLDEARRRSKERGVEVEWVQEDVRRLERPCEFDAVIHWFTSFGYFDDATNADVLVRIQRALKPGGALLLETMNLDQVLADSPGRSVRTVGPDRMEDEKRYDAATGRIHYRRTVRRRDRAPRVFEFFVRLFREDELERWLRRAGFAEVEAYGGQGEPFDEDSDRLIVVARRG